VTSRAAPAIVSPFDSGVERIDWAYTALGQVETVTQYNTTDTSSVADQVKYTYDAEWSRVSKVEYDHDSAVGSGTAYDLDFTYEETATSGRNTVRRTGVDLPSGRDLSNEYSSSSSLDHDASRVTQVKLVADNLVLAEYRYLGAGGVVQIEYQQPMVKHRVFEAAAESSYGRLDRFNRVDRYKWERIDSATVAFYDVDYGYDRNSWVTASNDLVHTPFNMSITRDNLNRGTTYSSTALYQAFGYSHTGNWKDTVLSLSGDTGGCDTADERDETRTYNLRNRPTDRDEDTACPGTDYAYDLAYDACGNLTDDGELYEYKYDVFYRLVEVRNQGGSVVLAHGQSTLLAASTLHAVCRSHG
jgi:YD repeat-containing protein